MVKGKLILICHYGGEFNRSDEGYSSYEGGEANAVNISSDTVFDDLKLKLAEMCNFEHKSVSVKYFLPGNSRSLINLGNNKDLMRMLSFHENSVTADIYIFGKEGFDSGTTKVNAGRVSGVKVAETVDHGTAGDVLSADTSDSSDSKTTSSFEPSDDSSDSYTPKNTKYKRYVPETSVMSPNSTGLDGKEVTDNCTAVRMVSTPADTVKKRRRAAASRGFGSDFVTAADDTEKRESVTRKKRPRRSAADMADEIAALPSDSDSDPEDSYAPSNLDNVAPGQVVASWKKAITSVGQEFKNVDEFREALRRYAVAHQFAYKLKKSDATRVSCKCADEDCPWRIYASKVQAGKAFRIKKMIKSHTCGGESRKSAQPTRRWLVSVVKEILQDVPHIKPKNIARRIIDDFGIQVKMYLVRRAIEDVKVEMMGSQAEAYDDLPKFCKRVAEVNPGTLVNLVTGDDKRFQRLFLCFHALACGFQNGCRPLLLLDSTSLRSKYHESLLVAVAIDGNDRLFPLAIAVVDVENEASWIWFLEQVKAAISSSMILTLVCDREKLQKESILKVFENSHIGYSLRHLISSFNINMKGPFSGEGRGFLAQSLSNAAHATRLDVFLKYMEEIKQISPSSYEWIQQTGPEHWASALFAGELYNQITENPLELLDKLLEEEKAFPITHKIEAIVNLMSELIIDRQTESSGWSTKLTPSKDSILRNRILKSQKLRVLFSNELLFEVRDDYTNAVNVFNITTMECSCGVWRITGIPCCHAIAVFNCTGRDAYDYCSPFFTVDRYTMTYSLSITPLLENDNENTSEVGEVIERLFLNIPVNECSSENVAGSNPLSENVNGNDHSSGNVGGNEHPSENIGGHEQLYEIVLGSVNPLEILVGNDHPEIVEGNEHLSGNVEGNEHPSDNMQCNQHPSDYAEDNQHPSNSIEGNQCPSIIVEGNERPCEIAGENEPTSEVVEVNHRLFEIVAGLEGSSEKAEGKERSSETVEEKGVSSENVEGKESSTLKGNKRSKEVEVLPPSSCRRSEQDKLKQTKPLDPSKRTVICTRCLGAGHNKKTCKVTLD